MMKPPEAVGAAPQAAVNPQAKMPPQAPRAPGKTPVLPPDQMAVLRKDPEIAKAVQIVLGKPMDLAKIPDELLMGIAGMVHKLGVDGAVKEFLAKIPPQILQQLRQSA